MKMIYRILFLLIPVSMKVFPIQASHLVVGEMSYRHTGNNIYEFTLYYYRDCRPPSQGGGNPAALQSDDPAFVSIYDGNTLFSFDSVYSTSTYVLPKENPNACENANEKSCLSVVVFKFTKLLPPSNNEYTILNQRCCMAETIGNIANPGTHGYSFYCKIPAQTQGLNNSAVFVPVKNVKYCVNKKYTINHAASDNDGDSLSYGFTLHDLGADANDPKPVLGGTMPFIYTTNYLAPYSITNPIPGMTINEKTGMISLMSNIQGTFLVNVFCKEWRNGILINTIKRSFTYTISNCNFDVSAQIVCDTDLFDASSGNVCIANCENKTINFKNNSIGAVAYHWDFGVNTALDDTSNAFEPAFLFPDTGRYQVTLIAYGANCTDSIVQNITIFQDELTAAFLYNGKLCTGNTIQFSSTSSSLNDYIAYWKWEFVNPDLTYYSIDEHPEMQFAKTGNYHVTLNTYNSHGCSVTATKDIDLSTVEVKAYNDTIVPKGIEVNVYATGADNYFWYMYGNSGLLTSDNTPNTTLETYKADIINVYVNGTNSDGCVGTDSVKITITNGETIFVPTAFSPNGDNLHDVVKPFLSGYKLKYFRIYNRRGQQVFNSSDPDYGWDGIFNGQPMGIDTYFWVASVEDIGKSVKIFKGDIVLVR